MDPQFSRFCPLQDRLGFVDLVRRSVGNDQVLSRSADKDRGRWTSNKASDLVVFMGVSITQV